MLALENRVDARLNSMQQGMKDLNKAMTALEIDVAMVKDRSACDPARYPAFTGAQSWVVDREDQS
jgi:hypothetical protein